MLWNMNMKIKIVAQMRGPDNMLLVGKVTSSTAKPIADITAVGIYLLVTDMMAEMVAISQSQRHHLHLSWISLSPIHCCLIDDTSTCVWTYLEAELLISLVGHRDRW